MIDLLQLTQHHCLDQYMIEYDKRLQDLQIKIVQYLGE